MAMKAMILAAGRGQRMGTLTDSLPKPLIRLRGRALIDYHIESLAACGVRDFVINSGWLGERLHEHVGDGSAYGVRVAWSDEGWPALETGGGLRKALPLLGPAPFLVVNADVYVEYPWPRLLGMQLRTSLAHLVLVPNPEHNPGGDFTLREGRVVEPPHGDKLTYSGISVIDPALVAGQPAGARFQLAPLLREAAAAGRVGAERFEGKWSDVGTPERLAALESLR